MPNVAVAADANPIVLTRPAVRISEARKNALAVCMQIVFLCVAVGVVYVVIAWLPANRADHSRPGLAPSILATAVVALTFGRMKAASRYIANRVVFGKRATPLEVVTELADRVVRDHTGSEMVDQMAHVIARGTGAERAAVLLRVDGRLHTAGSFPDTRTEVEPDLRVTVEEAGEELGALAIWKPAGALPSDVKLLTDLASIGRVVLRNLHLQAELQARVDELDAQSRALRASRRRIVEAQDEERRTLERDIHDGTQQYLTALGMKLGHAKVVVAKERMLPPSVAGDVDALAAEALDAVGDLTVSLYPRELIDHGIVAALRARAERFSFDVAVAGGAGRYDPALEACVYFTCIEALQNAAKHARPSLVSIEFAERGDELVFTVTDDGVGFDVSSTRGTGLRNMADRIGAFGGVVEVRSEPGRGTRVTGAVPVAAATS